MQKKRGRRLKFSMANWKNCRPSFDLLRKVIQGRPSLRSLLAPRRGRPKREIGARLLGTWRKRHPGSVPIPAEFLRFHSSSSALPTRFFRTKSDLQIAKKNLVLIDHPKVVKWLSTIFSMPLKKNKCRPLKRWWAGINKYSDDILYFHHMSLKFSRLL